MSCTALDVSPVPWVGGPVLGAAGSRCIQFQRRAHPTVTSGPAFCARSGLITRNVRRGVEHFHSTAFPLAPFLPAVSRECDFPYKPSPDALVHICATWGIPPHECLMIGDSAKDDVRAPLCCMRAPYHVAWCCKHLSQPLPGHDLGAVRSPHPGQVASQSTLDACCP
jgi:hypothetical protein